MRIATIIIGFLLGVLMTFQVLLANVAVGVGTEMGNAEAQAQEGAIAAGIFVMFLWLIGIAFAYPFPWVAVVSFIVASPIAFAIGANSIHADMAVWGVISVILGIMSYFGTREKKRKNKESKELRDALLAIQSNTAATPTT